ncbi:MAG: Smr/MutS family protein [Treponema sp.]|jgi:DNA-nicking Smr family endonuclease|nr:Smr/MutS family protein [Treponema sp.]
MDFGDILDQWDKQTARTRKSGKGVSGNGKTEEEPERVDPLEVWLRVNGIYDKDMDAETGRTDDAGTKRRRLLAKTADAVLDLHGMTHDEAWTALDTFFRDSRRRGFEKLLVIHGKGNHTQRNVVLKETVRSFIEKCPFAGESGHGGAAMGGSGATWVLLKEIPACQESWQLNFSHERAPKAL